MEPILIKIEDKSVVIDVTEQQAAEFVAKEIEKLQNKINGLQAMDAFDQAEAAAQSLKSKLVKLHKEDKLLVHYEYETLKARQTGESLGAFLRENGVAETLIGSAERGHKQAIASITALKAAGISDEKVLENSLRVALNAGRAKEWTELVIQFALENN